MEGSDNPLEDIQRKRQTSIQKWKRKRARVDESVQEVENISEGRKMEAVTSKPSQRKRTRGKLTKKEQKRMKQTH